MYHSQCAHSMRLREKALTVWVAIKEDATVVTGHCDCMAGASEACSHLAATLFFIAKSAESVSKACTSQPCSWNRPGNGRDVDYAEGVSINFSRPKLEHVAARPSPPATPDRPTSTPECAAAPSTPDSRPSTPGSSIPDTPDTARFKRVQHRQQQCSEFYKRLAQCKSRPVLLALVPGHCDSFQPKAMQLNLPKPLSTLTDTHHRDCSQLDFPGILTKCEEIFKSMTFTPEQV